VYLEIGSHLGGTIQPHLLDHRCRLIISIDPRPQVQPDDRSPGHLEEYEGNSTERMLGLLSALDQAGIEKVVCLESDASRVSISDLPRRPDFIFIDGEHTEPAALSDFEFAQRAVAEGGIIAFHDHGIVHAAVRESCRRLRRTGVQFEAAKLGGSVFGIFFDRSLLINDPELSALAEQNRYFWWRFRARLAIKWLREALRQVLRTGG
jgi:hypothetical protein